ncbi:DUF4954 family protein [Spirochaetia bacterium 38H-sp]|uniref:DUF4954 family protein n=1 Tax=Rarispira pelagica TaxID=3141764 RepID=A0ABU9U923_9SPIR
MKETIIQALRRETALEKEINMLKEKIKNIKSRALSKEEINILEKQGNISSDWSKIRVAEDFNPKCIFYSFFIGDCYISKIEKQDIYSYPSGIYHSTIKESIILDTCSINRCAMLDNFIIDKNALLIEVTGSNKNQFTPGIGPKISCGIETGGREINLSVFITPEIAEVFTSRPLDKKTIEEEKKRIEEYRSLAGMTKTYIGKNCILQNAKDLEECWIGDNSKITSSIIRKSTIISSLDSPVNISHNSYIENSIIQYGAEIKRGAIVRSSLIMETSGAEDHGKIDSCIIFPNTHIAKGEVTASLIGPFVGMHHQSLLIAAYWPEGKGNVAYGANVGSNHTSRQPDQEIWPGEGMFFGLGCVVKFPANFRNAPYSTIASGITTLPQKMEFPFSLIVQPLSPIEDVPPAFNQIIPAWALTSNLYGIFRNQEKFRTRNRAKYYSPVYEIFRPKIIKLMHTALKRLQNPPEISNIYKSGDIRGLGKNVLLEADRLRAIDAYRFFINYGLLRIILGIVKTKETESWKKEIADITEEYDLTSQPRPILIQKYMEMLPIIRESITKSRKKDFIRGRRVIDDYDLTHQEEDAFFKAIEKRFKEEEEALL